MTSDEFIRTKYAIPKEYQYELTTEQWLESMEEYAAFKNDNGASDMPFTWWITNGNPAILVQFKIRGWSGK